MENFNHRKCSPSLLAVCFEFTDVTCWHRIVYLCPLPPVFEKKLRTEGEQKREPEKETNFPLTLRFGVPFVVLMRPAIAADHQLQTH